MKARLSVTTLPIRNCVIFLDFEIVPNFNLKTHSNVPYRIVQDKLIGKMNYLVTNEAVPRPSKSTINQLNNSVQLHGIISVIHLCLEFCTYIKLEYTYFETDNSYDPRHHVPGLFFFGRTWSQESQRFENGIPKMLSEHVFSCHSTQSSSHEQEDD